MHLDWLPLIFFYIGKFISENFSATKNEKCLLVNVNVAYRLFQLKANYLMTMPEMSEWVSEWVRG